MRVLLLSTLSFIIISSGCTFIGGATGAIIDAITDNSTTSGGYELVSYPAGKAVTISYDGGKSIKGSIVKLDSLTVDERKKYCSTKDERSVVPIVCPETGDSLTVSTYTYAGSNNREWRVQLRSLTLQAIQAYDEKGNTKIFSRHEIRKILDAHGMTWEDEYIEKFMLMGSAIVVKKEMWDYRIPCAQVEYVEIDNAKYGMIIGAAIGLTIDILIVISFRGFCTGHC